VIEHTRRLGGTRFARGTGERERTIFSISSAAKATFVAWKPIVRKEAINPSKSTPLSNSYLHLGDQQRQVTLAPTNPQAQDLAESAKTRRSPFHDGCAGRHVLAANHNETIWSVLWLDCGVQIGSTSSSGRGSVCCGCRSGGSLGGRHLVRNGLHANPCSRGRAENPAASRS